MKKIFGYNVRLKNCYYGCSNDQVAVNDGDLINHLVTENRHADTSTLNAIDQLSLGLCAGKVTAVPLTPTPSETSKFSLSKEFSYSSDFSKSQAFSFSAKFGKTDCFSDSEKFTKTSEFSKEFSQKVEIVDRDPSESNDNKKNNTGMIAGITVATVAIVAAIIVAAFFIIRKKRAMINEEDIETLDEDQSTINRINPLYDKKAADNPFKEDF